MVQYIKIFDIQKAKQLESLGYTYMLEKINNKDIYVFQAVPDIVKFVQSSFDKGDFILGKTLNF